MDTDAVFELGRVLHAAGYDTDGVTAALDNLEVRVARALGSTRPTLVDEPLASLVDLFHVLRPVPRDTAAALVDVDALVAAGLLAADGENVVAPFQISPWLGLLVAHHPVDLLNFRPDFVSGGNKAAETLARATVRVRAGRMLDLGAGSGAQSLLAAPHSGEVVAVDVNPKAVELTRLNAALNGFDNVEARQGDWFEPVRDEEFGLVVANPPFVVSPDTELLFRDGDRRGDDLYGIVPMVVRGVGEHLAPGGIGHVLCEWPVRAGEDPHDGPRAWTEGLGRDVCLVDFGSEAPLRYASRWNLHLPDHHPERFEATVGRWLAHYREQGIVELRYGLVVLRRGFSGEPWFHAVDAASLPHGDGGRQLRRMIEAQDYLNGTGPLEPRLADERFRSVEGHAILERNNFRDGSYDPVEPSVTLDDGLGTVVRLEPVALEIFLALDGEQTLAETLSGLAARLEVDPAWLADFGTGSVRELLAVGLVERL